MNRVYFLFLLSAGLVTILRFFTLTDLGYDLTYQIQPAQHFLEGKGFGSYISKPGYLFEKDYVQLAHFPLGYSIYTAAVLALGIPLALVTKIFGAFCTMAGWAGWGIFYISAQREWNPLPSRFQIGIGYLLAISLPLFATPVWDGTDIFLWASVPWILLCLAKAVRSEPNPAKFYLIAGFLCGLCCLMRYASVVVVLFSCLAILLQTIPSPRIFCRRICAFGLGALLPISIQIYQLLFVAAPGATPGGVGGEKKIDAILQKLVASFELLPTANWALLFWLPDRFLREMTPGQGEMVLCVLVYLVLLSLAFFVIKKSETKTIVNRFGSLPNLGVGLVLVVPFLLLLATAVGSYPYVGDRRQFQYLVPLVIFLAALPAFQFRATKFPALLSSGYLIAYAIIFLMSVIFVFLPNAHGKVARKKLMGESRLETFPSTGLEYERCASRREVLKLLAENEKIHLFTSLDHWFSADRNVKRNKVTRIPACDYIQGVKIQGPLELVIFSMDGGGGDLDIYELDGRGEVMFSACFQKIPNMVIYQRFDPDGFMPYPTKILKATIPEGTLLSLE
jgi:hypothetical protein